MRKIPILLTTIFVLFISTGLQQAQAQTNGEQDLIEALESIFSNDTFNLGLTLQSQAEVHWDPDFQGQNTFRVSTARIKAYGNLGDNFSYFAQTDISASPGILDAILTFKNERFSISAGATKPTLSTEYLLGTNATDFINRARIVSMLAGQRDIGLKANYTLSPGFTLSGGMFNGTNQRFENSNNSFYYTGRLSYANEIDENTFFSAAVNGGFSQENGVQIGSAFLPAVNGDRAIYGGDFRLEVNRFLLSSEILWADLEYGPGIEDDVTGFHITGG